MPFEALQISVAFRKIILGIHGFRDTFEAFYLGDPAIFHLNNHGLRLRHIDANKPAVIVTNPIDSLGIVAVHADMMNITILEKRGDIPAFDLVEALYCVLRDDESIAFLQHPFYRTFLDSNVDIRARHLAIFGPKDRCYTHPNGGI